MEFDDVWTILSANGIALDLNQYLNAIIKTMENLFF